MKIKKTLIALVLIVLVFPSVSAFASYKNTDGKIETSVKEFFTEKVTKYQTYNSLEEIQDKYENNDLNFNEDKINLREPQPWNDEIFKDIEVTVDLERIGESSFEITYEMRNRGEVDMIFFAREYVLKYNEELKIWEIYSESLQEVNLSHGMGIGHVSAANFEPGYYIVGIMAPNLVDQIIENNWDYEVFEVY